MTDWATLKMGYEILGTGVRDLAIEGGTTVQMIEYAIDNEDWKRQAVANLLPEPAPAGEIMVEVQGRLDALYTLKQSAFNDRYIKLESVILSKAIEIITSLQTDDPGAALTLKQVNDILSDLKDKAMLDGAKSRKDEAGGSGGVTVQIMQNFSGHAAEAVGDFDVQIAGSPDHVVGDTN